MGKFIWLCQIPSLLLVLFLLSVVDSSLNLSHSSPNPSPLCLPEETSALLQFKNSLSINHYDHCAGSFTSYPKTNSWNESTNCCSWEGVTCNMATGQVIGLDLSCSLLSGSFPPNSSLFRLQGLKLLNLAYNDFEGSLIPSGFAQLVSLTHLNLSGSSFSGLVPSYISLLSKLISLDLSENWYDLKFDSHSFDMLTRNLSELENLFLAHVNMSNVVPTSFKNLSSSLKRLGLSACDLQGEFPSEIFQLPYLEYLDLYLNSLTGYLPQSNWSSPLSLLDLSNNSFRESIPSSLGNLTKITFLDLSFNKFEGQIPDVFANLNKLTSLNLRYCNFSGQLPSTLFNLTQLTELYLSGNRLEGPLLTHASGLQNLEELQLNDNSLSGAIPSWLFTLPSLDYIDLSGNRLTALINHIQEPNSVQYVDLADNDIRGEIPSSFFDLVNLTYLDVSSNNFSGVIQSEMMSKIENLETLDLSSNNFSGVIKLDVLSKLKNLTTLDLSNNKLLSWSSDNGVKSSAFQNLHTFSFSSCNVSRFPNFLCSAKSLSDLDLSNNNIHGPIFKWESDGWEQLTTLNLSHNFLTSLEQFPGRNLRILDLHSNLLQGRLPAPPPSVQEFLISNNNLTGEIPPSICKMTSLGILDLSRNYLEGIIPACLGNLIPLQSINLQMNNFHGEIPDFCVEHHGLLTTLALNDNQLEGLLPRSLVNCTRLQFLNLANNTLNDLFPHWLGKLQNLKVLILRSNRFHGRLDNSTAISRFYRLKIIDLSQNEFTGPLPTKFFQSLEAMKVVDYSPVAPLVVCANIFACRGFGYTLSSEKKGQNFVKVTMKRLEIELDLEKSFAGFTLVDFSNNRFYGGIPEVLGELCALLVLNLSDNSLSGPLPPSLGSMAALESLDLSSNKLSGRIPFELTNLTFLEVLNLSQNKFVGPIPLGKQFNTFENDSYSGNSALCGFPLSKKCGNREEPKPPTSKLVEDEGSAIAFIWELALMGYGCGVVLGLSMGYIVFTTGRPWWFVRMVERDWQTNVTRWICRTRGRRIKYFIPNSLWRSN